MNKEKAIGRTETIFQCYIEFIVGFKDKDPELFTTIQHTLDYIKENLK